MLFNITGIGKEIKFAEKQLNLGGKIQPKMR